MKKWNVGWGTVSLCNMNCQFCYSKSKRKDSKDLSLNDWIRFIDENHDRINTINYGTGENTLDNNWFVLVKYIRKNFPEIKQALTTNGHLAESVKDNDKMSIFLDAIDEVDVSLDFCDEKQHIAFRGQPKAYQWAVQTLKLCQDSHKRTTIVFLGSQKNIYKENIDGLFDIAKEFGTILRMNMYRPTEGINSFSQQFIINYDTFVGAIKYIGSKYKILSINDALFSSILTNNTVKDPSGDRSIRILSDGCITPSTYLINQDYIIANIKDSFVLKTLENYKKIDRIVHKVIPKDCQGCVYIDSCAGGVYDRRYLWYGDLEHKDPYCKGPYKEKNTDAVVLTDSDFQSVHDGYLPTIFFKP